MRYTFVGCCASTAYGAMRKLRVRATMHPAVPYHMVVSFSRSADFLPFKEAEQLIERQRRRNIQYRWILRLILRQNTVTCSPQDTQLMAIQRTQRGHRAPVWSRKMSMSNARLDRSPRGTAHPLSEEAERLIERQIRRHIQYHL